MNDKIRDINTIRIALMCKGIKITRHRSLIIDTLYKSNTHMSVYEIYNILKAKNIGLSTVYRNLIILECAGVVKKFTISNVNYYEIEYPDKYNIHMHAKCTRCGKITDIHNNRVLAQFNDLFKNMEHESRIIIKSSSILLTGICYDCQKSLYKI